MKKALLALAVAAVLTVSATGYAQDDCGWDDDNILADPGFREIGDDGAFIYWYAPPNVPRISGTPDRGACLLVEGDWRPICLQESSDWLAEPTWGDIDEASFRLKCGGRSCTARIDVAIEMSEAGDCEGPEVLEMTDEDGYPLEYGFENDWAVAPVPQNGVCVYLQFIEVRRGWHRYQYTLDLPDRRIESVGVTRRELDYPIWVDNAVLSSDDLDDD